MKVLNRLQHALKHFGLHFLVGATLTIGGHGMYTVSEELVELPDFGEYEVKTFITSDDIEENLSKDINKALHQMHITLVAAFRRALHAGMSLVVIGMAYLALTLALCIASVRSNERSQQ